MDQEVENGILIEDDGGFVNFIPCPPEFYLDLSEENSQKRDSHLSVCFAIEDAVSESFENVIVVDFNKKTIY